MDIQEILDRVQGMNKQETKIILEAVIRKRESQLDGGEVIWREFTRDEVAHIKEICARAMTIRAEDGPDEELNDAQVEKRWKEDLLRQIACADEMEIEDILSIAMKRKEELYPQWDMVYLALQKDDLEKRRATLTSLLRWEEMYIAQCEKERAAQADQ